MSQRIRKGLLAVLGVAMAAVVATPDLAQAQCRPGGGAGASSGLRTMNPSGGQRATFMAGNTQNATLQALRQQQNLWAAQQQATFRALVQQQQQAALLAAVQQQNALPNANGALQQQNAALIAVLQQQQQQLAALQAALRQMQQRNLVGQAR